MLMHPMLLLDDWQLALYAAIILVALMSAIALLLIVVLILEVVGLVRQVRGEIGPLVQEAHRTVRTVQGTTEFVSTGLIKPAIQTASIAAGVARTISVLRSGIIHPRERDTARRTVVERDEYVVRPEGATVERQEYVVSPSGGNGDRRA